MTFSKEQLEKIRELAGFLMRPDQIARLIDIPPGKLRTAIKTTDSPAQIAYETGKAETILEFRKQEVTLAKMGSPLAVEMMERFIIDQKQGEK